MAVEERPGERDLLGALLEETLELARRTRDLLEAEAARDRQRSGAPPVPAELERAVRTGRIATRLSACMAWLLARRAVGAGELSADRARGEAWRLLPLEGDFWEAPETEEEETLGRLAVRAERLYARVRRLDRSLDGPSQRGIVEPGQGA